MSIRKFYPMQACKNHARPLRHGAVTDLNAQFSMMNQQPTPGRNLGIDARKKIPGEGFKRPWPPLIKVDESVRKKINSLLGGKR